jgi:hypothetical protein
MLSPAAVQVMNIVFLAAPRARACKTGTTGCRIKQRNMTLILQYKNKPIF